MSLYMQNHKHTFKKEKSHTFYAVLVFPQYQIQNGIVDVWGMYMQDVSTLSKALTAPSGTPYSPKPWNCTVREKESTVTLFTFLVIKEDARMDVPYNLKCSKTYEMEPHKTDELR